jgi:hypothetical protein
LERLIDIETNSEDLNEWVRQSIDLFRNTNYLDQILEVYPFQIAAPERLDPGIRRRIIAAHQGRRTEELIEILNGLTKFPYEDPIWYLLKNIEGCIANNPRQIQRIAESLYSMTAEETVVRLEAAPKLNTQMGPMFNGWLRRNFNLLELDAFQRSTRGVCILDSSEEVGKEFINDTLSQNLAKRPDLIAKVNRQIIIGEATFFASPDFKRGKEYHYVLDFVKNQRGLVRRIGLVDGFIWTDSLNSFNVDNILEIITVQETEYNIFSCLLLEKYLKTLIHS